MILDCGNGFELTVGLRVGEAVRSQGTLVALYPWFPPVPLPAHQQLWEYLLHFCPASWGQCGKPWGQHFFISGKLCFLGGPIPETPAQVACLSHTLGGGVWNLHSGLFLG